MIRSDSQFGVAAIPLLATGAFIVVVLGVVIYAANGMKTATPKVNQPTTATKSPLPSSQSAKPASEFDVTDLGFKLSLPSGLTGVTQLVQQNQTGPGIGLDTYNYSVAILSNSTLTADDPANCSASSAALGSISKYAFDPVGVDQLSADSNTIQLGSYWLSYHAPQESCSQNPAVISYQNSLIPLMEQAFETASPLQ